MGTELHVKDPRTAGAPLVSRMVPVVIMLLLNNINIIKKPRQEQQRFVFLRKKVRRQERPQVSIRMRGRAKSARCFGSVMFEVEVVRRKEERIYQGSQGYVGWQGYEY